jgi:hypothetical protein
LRSVLELLGAVASFYRNSLTFDSSPLKEGFEILGAPVVTLDLAVGNQWRFSASA